MLSSLNPKDCITALSVCFTIILLVDRSLVETVPATCQVFKVTESELMHDCVACVNIQHPSMIQHKRVRSVAVVLDDSVGASSESLLNAYIMESNECHVNCKALLNPDDFTLNFQESKAIIKGIQKTTEVFQKRSVLSQIPLDISLRDATRLFVVRYRIKTGRQATQIKVTYTQQNYYIRLILIMMSVMSSIENFWLVLLTIIPHIEWLTIPAYLYSSEIFGSQTTLIAILHLSVFFLNYLYMSNLMPIISKLISIIVISYVNFSQLDIRIFIVSFCCFAIWLWKDDQVGLLLFWVVLYCFRKGMEQEKEGQQQLQSQDTDINV